MKKILSLTGVLCLFAALVAAQPAIDGVFNAASYAAPGLPNAAIAQGSIFVIFGRNLGPPTLQKSGFPLQSGFAGTTVQVSIGGQSFPAPILYTSATQVAAIMPSRVPAGTGTLTVQGASAPITVARSGFGIFAINQAGSGPGVITDANFQVNVVTAAAQPGQAMVLWGTGLGPVDFDETTGAPVRDLRPADLEVRVGGRPAEVLFAGRAPGFAGLDQINFTVPAGVEGCYVPLVVRVAGVPSNFTTMSIAASRRVCSDPTSFADTDLEQVEGKDVRIGTISLARVDLALPAIPGLPFSSVKTDVGSASLSKYSFAQLLGSRGLGFTTMGQCTVYTFKGQPDTSNLTPRDAAEGLDAGPFLTVTGPSGTRRLDRTAKGLYSASLGGTSFPGAPGGGQPEFLAPGAYTVDNGSGGADVQAFRATLNITGAVNWQRERVPDTVPRAQDLTVNWTGGAANDLALIIGLSARKNPDAWGEFVCTERAGAGSFTVPSWVLSALPASAVNTGSFSLIPTGALLVGSAANPQPNRFRAPGLDLGLFDYSLLTMKLIIFQ